MKQVRLLELELTNYRNIEHEVYVFNGTNSKIVGENRIGKTNTLEAIYFLLTNCLLDSSSDLTALKPLDDTSKVVSVKGTFEVDNKKITLEKHYAEEWVKTRGTTDLVLKGHYEDYVFNGVVQTKAKDYYNLLEEHFGFRNDEKGDVDVAQMLINPLYIGNLGDSKDWSNLRKFIIKIIGDVTNEEVFEKEPKTVLIKEDLEKALNNVEQVKKQYVNDIKGLTTTITAYNSNIGLLEKTSRPTDEEVVLATKGVEECTSQIEDIKNGINQEDKELKELDDKVYALQKEVLELNTKEFTDYQKANTSEGKKNDEIDKLKDEIEKQLDVITDKKFVLSNAKSNAYSSQSNVSRCENTRAKLGEKYKSIKQELADVDKQIITVCPTCHRPLEEKDIEEARATLVSGLEEKLKEVIEEGKKNTDELTKHKEELIKHNDEVAKALAEIDETNKVIDELKLKLSELKLVANDEETPTTQFVESKELQSKRLELKKAEEELTSLKEKNSQKHTNNMETIEEIKTKRETFQKVLNDKDYYDRQMKVLEGVKAQKKEANEKLADVEQKKECLELFSYTRLHLLDTHTARVFGNIRFQLIRENINGGFDTVCKPYIYGIDKGVSTNTIWKSGSKSEKIATGIAIIEAIRKELGCPELPILFDEGGEISTDTLTNRLKTDAQIICVRVEDDILKPVVVNF